jgi:hypothetical protein
MPPNERGRYAKQMNVNTNDLAPSEQLAYSTVRIECVTASGLATGTGFFYAFGGDGAPEIVVLVTNKHVIAGSSLGRLTVHVTTHDKPIPTAITTVELPNFENLWLAHPDPDVDLCVMPIGLLADLVMSGNRKLFLIALDKKHILTTEDTQKLMGVEEVIMIGYPNGIWDHVNNAPIFRRGITATHPNTDYCGRKEFMIDVACFPGSSGSPVLLYNFGNFTDRMGGLKIGSRIALLGILYAGPQHTATGEIVVKTIPTNAKPMAISRIPNNLGVVIKSMRLMDFESIIQRVVTVNTA